MAEDKTSANEKEKQINENHCKSQSFQLGLQIKC